MRPTATEHACASVNCCLATPQAAHRTVGKQWETPSRPPIAGPRGQPAGRSTRSKVLEIGSGLRLVPGRDQAQNCQTFLAGRALHRGASALTQSRYERRPARCRNPTMAESATAIVSVAPYGLPLAASRAGLRTVIARA